MWKSLEMTTLGLMITCNVVDANSYTVVHLNSLARCSVGPWSLTDDGVRLWNVFLQPCLCKAHNSTLPLGLSRHIELIWTFTRDLTIPSTNERRKLCIFSFLDSIWPCTSLVSPASTRLSHYATEHMSKNSLSNSCGGFGRARLPTT